MSLVTAESVAANRLSGAPPLAERERAAVRALLQLADDVARREAEKPKRRPKSCGWPQSIRPFGRPSSTRRKPRR